MRILNTEKTGVLKLYTRECTRIFCIHLLVFMYRGLIFPWQIALQNNFSYE